MIPFSNLQRLVTHATRRDGAPLYRRLYDMTQDEHAKEIKSEDEWKSLPFLTKKHILETPISERTFIPWRTVRALEATSGTSGKPPVFVPWTFDKHGYGYRRDHFEFKHATLSSITASQQQEWILGSNVSPSALMVLDPKYPELSVRLAAALGVDSMFLYVFNIRAIAEEMERQGIAQNIKFIEYYGESATAASLKFIAQKFPNAVISAEYASMDVEANPIGVVCQPRGADWQYETFHGTDLFHYELVSIESGALLPIRKGIEGDLVLTSGTETSAFPLIRYRLGDTVRVEKEVCEQHGTWSFRVLGRTENDFIKVQGGMLRVDEIERVLKTLANPTPDEFQLIARERAGAPLEVSLHMHLKNGDSPEALSDSVAHSLRLGPSFTYQEGVIKGLYAPLRCVALTPGAERLAKRKRMVYEVAE